MQFLPNVISSHRVSLFQLLKLTECTIITCCTEFLTKSFPFHIWLFAEEQSFVFNQMFSSWAKPLELSSVLGTGLRSLAPHLKSFLGELMISGGIIIALNPSKYKCFWKGVWTRNETNPSEKTSPEPQGKVKWPTGCSFCSSKWLIAPLRTSEVNRKQTA